MKINEQRILAYAKVMTEISKNEAMAFYKSVKSQPHFADLADAVREKYLELTGGE